MRKILGGTTWTTIFRSLLIFVMMATGVTAGLYIAKEAGIVTWSQRLSLTPSDLQNTTYLKLGDKCPDVSVLDSTEQPVGLASLVKGERTIVGVVSYGCEACDDLMRAITAGKIVPDDTRLILLTLEPEYFSKTYSFPTYRITQDFIESVALTTSPTILGVNEDGNLGVICSGFTELIDADFMEEYL